ncbi:MAG: glycoside hydrolase family 71/99-like protein [Cyclobacteriaceae bacterium]
MAFAWMVILMSLLGGCSGDDDKSPDDPAIDNHPVVKTNPMQIYMHYMPWFQTKSYSGYWGSHWKMANQNPDIVDENGKHQIASHYYPLIGPYDSKDPDVVEYHLLLMKYAGVDAVLIDWYGSHNVNDYGVNLSGANALIDRMDDVGLKYALVYEEYTVEAVQAQTGKTALYAAQLDMKYAEETYFSKPEYLSFNKTPLLLTFGPRYFRDGSKWEQIFSALKAKPRFLPLWDHGAYTGSTDNGEFAWVDFNASLSKLDLFYNKESLYEMMIGSAYPRFHDFYEEGGWGDSYGYVDPADGATFFNTLNKAKDRGIDYLQLVTWNDFGEGTVIEPTLEDEFRNLQQLQEFTGVSYGLDELQLIHQYYLKKKELKGNTEAQTVLAQIFKSLCELDVAHATELMNQLN